MFRQKQRLIVLVSYVLALFVVNYAAFGQFPTLAGGKSLWFYTALANILLGNLLVTPFYVKPVDVVAYSVAGIVALGSVQMWNAWQALERAVFAIGCGYCIVTLLLAVGTILTKDLSSELARQWHQTCRSLANTLGNQTVLFSIVMLVAIFIFHRSSNRETAVILISWAIICSRPENLLAKVIGQLRLIWRSGPPIHVFGSVVAYQTPNIVLIRQDRTDAVAFGTYLLIRDLRAPSKLTMAMDYVGRDEGLLLRALEISAPALANEECEAVLGTVPQNCAATVTFSGDCQAALAQSHLPDQQERFVGIVAPETTLNRLFFEVVRPLDLQEGALIEVAINTRVIAYQIIEGMTREDTVFRKNTFGYVRGEARKIGIWDATQNRFHRAQWLPSPNSPVLLAIQNDPGPLPVEAVGRFPGTSYTARITSISSLVTHNTAILGILGIGKTMLALELVERMIAEGIKVVCLDLTNQYENQLPEFFDAAALNHERQLLNQTGEAGENNVQQNVEEGGSINEFRDLLREQLQPFITTNDAGFFRIYNPSSFTVWGQDSKQYKGSASMATLTPTEITHAFCDVALSLVQDLGETDHARVCLVFEEAHSLVPEWSSAVAEGDKSATNGTARAILQGRKFGMGCLLISQRTANVTKTILNQCNTVFAMRTFDDTGRDFLANYIGGEYADILPNLEERHAVFFGKASSCENPIVIRLNDQDQFRAVFRQAHPPPQLPVAPASPAAAAPAQAQAPDEPDEDEIPF
jgi:hypothetical protein